MNIQAKNRAAVIAEDAAAFGGSMHVSSCRRQPGRARRNLTRLLGVGLFLAVGTFPALAANDPLLSRLVGEWIGQGTVKKSASAAPERIYCKVANKLVDGGTVLEQKGRCAVATNSGRLTGKIAAKGGGRYEGSLDLPQTKGPATLAGRGESDKIVLSASFVDRFTKRPRKSTISLVVGDGSAYRLVSDTSDILFKPDK